MTALAVRTWADVVNSVAYEYGRWFTDREAIGILWEYTGYPGFFMHDPAAEAAEQLRALFEGDNDDLSVPVPPDE